MPIDALSILCAQLTRDLLAIAKFLFTAAVVHFLAKLSAFRWYNGADEVGQGITGARGSAINNQLISIDLSSLRTHVCQLKYDIRHTKVRAVLSTTVQFQALQSESTKSKRRRLIVLYTTARRCSLNRVDSRHWLGKMKPYPWGTRPQRS